MKILLLVLVSIPSYVLADNFSTTSTGVPQMESESQSVSSTETVGGSSACKYGAPQVVKPECDPEAVPWRGAKFLEHVAENIHRDILYSADGSLVCSKGRIENYRDIQNFRCKNGQWEPEELKQQGWRTSFITDEATTTHKTLIYQRKQTGEKCDGASIEHVSKLSTFREDDKSAESKIMIEVNSGKDDGGICPDVETVNETISTRLHRTRYSLTSQRLWFRFHPTLEDNGQIDQTALFQIDEPEPQELSRSYFYKWIDNGRPIHHSIMLYNENWERYWFIDKISMGGKDARREIGDFKKGDGNLSVKRLSGPEEEEVTSLDAKWTDHKLTESNFCEDSDIDSDCDEKTIRAVHGLIYRWEEAEKQGNKIEGRFRGDLFGFVGTLFPDMDLPPLLGHRTPMDLFYSIRDKLEFSRYFDTNVIPEAPKRSIVEDAPAYGEK